MNCIFLKCLCKVELYYRVSENYGLDTKKMTNPLRICKKNTKTNIQNQKIERLAKN